VMAGASFFAKNLLNMFEGQLHLPPLLQHHKVGIWGSNQPMLQCLLLPLFQMFLPHLRHNLINNHPKPFCGYRLQPPLQTQLQQRLPYRQSPSPCNCCASRKRQRQRERVPGVALVLAFARGIFVGVIAAKGTAANKASSYVALATLRHARYPGELSSSVPPRPCIGDLFINASSSMPGGMSFCMPGKLVIKASSPVPAAAVIRHSSSSEPNASVVINGSSCLPGFLQKLRSG